MKPEDILHFWFVEAGPAKWWQKSAEFDALISRRFGAAHAQASKEELSDWRATGRGRLAEILVLDQFSRNMYRDSAQAFAQDAMALVLAQEAVRLCVEQHWLPEWKCFLYLPYMHSESTKVHEQALELFRAPGLEENYDFEVRHKAIIDRFGRYPHRNAVLGRKSTPEEIAFLREPGSSF